ncbi:MAG: hypothetical protein Q8M31_01290 [Beijerinckiaceae bacterium]|nr:hypothetical protein [Beijerinckiaceae bacterium]
MTHIDPKRPADNAHSGSRSDPSVRGTDHGVNPAEPVIHDAAPVRSGGQARQAPPGRRVLFVLVAGLVLAMIAWAAVELFSSGPSRVSNTGEPSTTGTANQQPTAGGIPLSPPVGSPEGSGSQGQTAPGAVGRGSTSAPSPSSDSAR